MNKPEYSKDFMDAANMAGIGVQRLREAFAEIESRLSPYRSASLQFYKLAKSIRALKYRNPISRKRRRKMQKRTASRARRRWERLPVPCGVWVKPDGESVHIQDASSISNLSPHLA